MVQVFYSDIVRCGDETLDNAHPLVGIVGVLGLIGTPIALPNKAPVPWAAVLIREPQG